jgi:hypothetical protein
MLGSWAAGIISDNPVTNETAPRTGDVPRMWDLRHCIISDPSSRHGLGHDLVTKLRVYGSELPMEVDDKRTYQLH